MNVPSGHRRSVRHYHDPGDLHQLRFSCHGRLPSTWYNSLVGIFHWFPRARLAILSDVPFGPTAQRVLKLEKRQELITP